jgi:hypothetical protein
MSAAAVAAAMEAEAVAEQKRRPNQPPWERGAMVPCKPGALLTRSVRRHVRRSAARAEQKALPLCEPIFFAITASTAKYLI